MKKRSIILASILVLCFATAGFAASADWTEQRKARFEERKARQEAYINSEVQSGRMSQEVADAHRVVMNDHFKRGFASNSDWKEQRKLQFEERKARQEAFLNSEVQAGRMTQEVADAHRIVMNDHFKRMQENNFGPGPGFGQFHRGGGHGGGYGGGCNGGYGGRY